MTETTHKQDKDHIKGVIQDIFDRNLISHITDKEEFINLIQTGKCKLYIGIDPTADKYHIGHLAPYMLVRRLLAIGVKVVLLVGGFTGAVGDPSFKNTERPVMPASEVLSNTNSLMNKLKKFFGKYGDNIEYVNNHDWLSKMTLSDFLEYSGHFSANRLMKMEHIKQRLDNELHLSFKEVCYTLLQAIDFYYLFKNKGVNLQVGGNDQWINVINGVSLIDSMEKQTAIGLTVHLLSNSKGKKMGKTEEGAIWADGTMDVYGFWQYFRNLPDDDIKTLLYVFSLESIQLIDAKLANDDINNCKIWLADTMVKLVYGEDFQIQSIMDNEEEALVISAVDLINVLVELQFVENKSDAKRHIKSGAVRINGEKINDNIFFKNGEELTITLGKGKRKKIKVS